MAAATHAVLGANFPWYSCLLLGHVHPSFEERVLPLCCEIAQTCKALPPSLVVYAQGMPPRRVPPDSTALTQHTQLSTVPCTTTAGLQTGTDKLSAVKGVQCASVDGH